MTIRIRELTFTPELLPDAAQDYLLTSDSSNEIPYDLQELLNELVSEYFKTIIPLITNLQANLSQESRDKIVRYQEDPRMENILDLSMIKRHLSRLHAIFKNGEESDDVRYLVYPNRGELSEIDFIAAMLGLGFVAATAECENQTKIIIIERDRKTLEKVEIIPS